MNFSKTLFVDKDGELTIGGVKAASLAASYGTPLYVMDEAHIRAMCGVYRDTLAAHYGNSRVAYASKAFCCKAMYCIARSEGLYADVVSGGELYTAVQSGFDPSRIYLHGCNKLPHELQYAISCGVGTIVADNTEELRFINALAAEKGIKQRVLIRVNPGVEAHTHAFIQTAKPDSKFGVSIQDGEAYNAIKTVLSLDNLIFGGIHCHIGSQLFDREAYCLAIDKVTDFIAYLKNCSVNTEELNMGGGIGIHYSDDDPCYSYEDYALYIGELADYCKNCVSAKELAPLTLTVEPGRSIVGEAGVTLYKVGGIKDIKGVRKYVMVDGGMFDNPRFALYGAKYSAIAVSGADKPASDKVTLGGKCCESGDIVAADVMLQPVKTGDVIAVFSTGAYNYSMASNYNRNPIPPVVLVNSGSSEYIVLPQNYSDLTARDSIPDRLK